MINPYSRLEGRINRRTGKIICRSNIERDSYGFQHLSGYFSTIHNFCSTMRSSSRRRDASRTLDPIVDNAGINGLAGVTHRKRLTCSEKEVCLGQFLPENSSNEKSEHFKSLSVSDKKKSFMGKSIGISPIARNKTPAYRKKVLTKYCMDHNKTQLLASNNNFLRVLDDLSDVIENTDINAVHFQYDENRPDPYHENESIQRQVNNEKQEIITDNNNQMARSKKCKVGENISHSQSIPDNFVAIEENNNFQGNNDSNNEKSKKNCKLSPKKKTYNVLNIDKLKQMYNERKMAKESEAKLRIMQLKNKLNSLRNESLRNELETFENKKKCKKVNVSLNLEIPENTYCIKIEKTSAFKLYK